MDKVKRYESKPFIKTMTTKNGEKIGVEMMGLFDNVIQSYVDSKLWFTFLSDGRKSVLNVDLER